MKKIVPFNNVLKFKTDVSEITAISLEHKLNKEKDAVSGIFYISGEYKIMNGSMEKEPFKFDLPFDIALGANYDVDTLDIDIDDFRYELLDNNKLKIDIDLYLDGEELPMDREVIVEEEKMDDNDNEEKRDINLLEDMLDDKKEDINIEIDNDNNNTNTNLNTNSSDSPNEKEIDNTGYVTYRVYRVNPGDTIDSIISKYEITKDDLTEYNDNLDSIKTGDKLIIPLK